jgi:hypothetical protein
VHTPIKVGLFVFTLLVPAAVAQASDASPTVILSASPTSIPYTKSSTLAWTSTNATACSGTGKGFSPSGVSGSQVVSPYTTTAYGITCTGAGGSASQSATVTVTAAPTLAIGMTVAAVGTIYASPTPTPGALVIGSEAPGNQGVVIGGPASNSYTWWKVAFNDNLTGWVVQSAVAPPSPNAPILTFSANLPYIATGASSTLSWSSTNATSCSGVGFSPSGVSGSLSVSPSVSTTYTITCTGSGGSTTRTTPVIVNPPPTFSWGQSLPVTFNSPAIVPLGGTETRSLVFMDGSLYAGIGDWEDPDLGDAGVNAAQVARLDSPTGSWVQDQNFLAAASRAGVQEFQAIASMQMARFDHDSGNNPITPVDVLMAGFWNINVAGLEVGQKTVTTGGVGAQGTWAIDTLVAPPASAGQVRSFASYTDSVTNVEMAFAGSDPYGIFSGAFNSATNAIQWGATAEAGSGALTANGDRVMSFAACGGKLYASIYDAIVVRTDGTNPSWQIFYQGPAPPSGSSGFRGLTCVPNLNGAGSMLIASLEGPGDIYDIPLNGSPPTIELNTPNFLATQLGVWIDYVIGAYNNMIVYPQSGSTSCPDLLIGLSIIATTYPNAYENYYPNASYLVRHCNGVYGFHPIVDPSIAPAPPLIATRALAPSQFSSDPAGTIYSGGYDAHNETAHNTDWIYRGVPQ